MRKPHPAQLSADRHPESAYLPEFIGQTEVLPLIRVSHSELCHMRRNRDFPRPVARAVYRTADVLDWIADRKRGKPLRSYLERDRERITRVPDKHQGVRTEWLDPALLMTGDEVVEATRIPATTLNTWIRKLQFPRPLSPGKWSRKQVDNWIAERKAGKPLVGSNIVPMQWRPGGDEPGVSISDPELLRLCRLTTQQAYTLSKRGDFPKQIRRGQFPKARVEQWVIDRRKGVPLPVSNKVLRAWWPEHAACVPEHKRALVVARGRSDRAQARRAREAIAVPFPGPSEARSLLVSMAVAEERKRRMALPSGHPLRMPDVDSPEHAQAMARIYERIDKMWTPDAHPGQREVYDRMLWEHTHQRAYDTAVREGTLTPDAPAPTVAEMGVACTTPVAPLPVVWESDAKTLTQLADERVIEGNLTYHRHAKPGTPEWLEQAKREKPRAPIEVDTFGLDEF